MNNLMCSFGIEMVHNINGEIKNGNYFIPIDVDRKIKAYKLYEDTSKGL